MDKGRLDMEKVSTLAKQIRLLEIESKNINKRARENYLEQVSDFSEKMKQIGDEAGNKAKQVVDKVGEYITQNPQKSALIGVGIGVSIGVLIGTLLRRRKDD
jgi:ElaB protein